MKDSIAITPIGYIENGILHGSNAHLRKTPATIILKEELTEALDGIEEYSHIVVVFWMHVVSDTARNSSKEHPAYAPDTVGEIGVLATRLPSRPNPIGISIVPLIKREGARLFVSGIDAFDKTPVLDIKPYTGHALEAISEFDVPEWERAK